MVIMMKELATKRWYRFFQVGIATMYMLSLLGGIYLCKFIYKKNEIEWLFRPRLDSFRPLRAPFKFSLVPWMELCLYAISVFLLINLIRLSILYIVYGKDVEVVDYWLQRLKKIRLWFKFDKNSVNNN